MSGRKIKEERTRVKSWVRVQSRDAGKKGKTHRTMPP